MSCAPQKSQDEDSPSGDPERENFFAGFKAPMRCAPDRPGPGAGFHAPVIRFEFLWQQLPAPEAPSVFLLPGLFLPIFVSSILRR